MHQSPLRKMLYGLGKSGLVSPKNMARLRHFANYRRFPSFKNPTTLDEKIMWLLYNTDTTEWTRLTDKYLVREFVKERGEEATLVKLYGVYDHAAEIDWESLPQKFVLKTNNGSASVVLVNDKSQLDIAAVSQKLDGWLKPFGYETGEKHYFDIKPKIIIEELLENDSDVSTSIVDYKFWCFDGEPYLCFVAIDRDVEKGDVKFMLYTIDEWQALPELMSEKHSNVAKVAKPQMLEQMKEIARRLSAGFPQVRVDLYGVGDKVYFGEMTFTSNGAVNNFFSRKGQEVLGARLKLPERK